MTKILVKKQIDSKILKLAEKISGEFPAAEVFLVGGIVRDILIGRESYDYDLAVRKVAPKKLEKILGEIGKVDLVGKSFGVFKFRSEKLGITESMDIALPRTEHTILGTGDYHDFEVQSDPDLPIETDLSRRDFTINAMAYNLLTDELVDPYGGIDDLNKKIIRTVGTPADRFQEDFTRMMRAVRFAAQLDFTIEKNTATTIQKLAEKIKTVAMERINTEFTKIIMSANAEAGMTILHDLELLFHIIPELEKAVGVGQNHEHIYPVFEHLIKSLGFAAERDYSLEVRLAALFHDIAKPIVKRGVGLTSTFYNHDAVGARVTEKILTRLKYPNDIIKKVTHLVRHHMFFYALDTVSDAGIRRLLNRVGKEYINELIQVRICDRLGMGRPKAKPYKLIQLEERLQEVQWDPINATMLALKGDELMDILKITPGPRVGLLLNAVLSDVLDDPKKNTEKYLKKRLLELNELSDGELKKLRPNIAEYEEKRKREYFAKFKGVE